jgi:hypothetical protein
LDDRGEELLDRVERQIKIGSERRENGEREYWLAASGSGEKGIEPILDSLDSAWPDHVQRITPRK